MWRGFKPNNQARTKTMESTLFTTLSTNEEANLSGGGKRIKVKAKNIGAGGGAGSGGAVFGNSGDATGGDGVYND